MFFSINSKLKASITELQSVENLPPAVIEDRRLGKVCSRCQQEFGFFFNRGDPCPKCACKVCEKCRQAVTGSKHKWLCVLCNKQM